MDPTAAEPLLAAPDIAGSLWPAVVRLTVGAAVLAAAATAWLWWQRRSRGPSRQLEVLDRAFLARGVSVALLRVGERRLLIGVSGEGVRLIRDLESQLPAGGAAFAETLAEIAGAREIAR